ncbi:MAG: hypothetical protein MJA83_09340 [Gammaproteobacteria bacterium]|nr:hypothetical protein [Gammaproteobacteria bacterium]
MEDTNYTFPPYFEPFPATDALAGLATAMYEKLDNGIPATEPEQTDFWMELSGLIYVNYVITKQLHAYLNAIDTAGIQLPRDEQDLTERNMIREPLAVYAVK